MVSCTGFTAGGSVVDGASVAFIPGAGGLLSFLMTVCWSACGSLVVLLKRYLAEAVTLRRWAGRKQGESGEWHWAERLAGHRRWLPK